MHYSELRVKIRHKNTKLIFVFFVIFTCHADLINRDCLLIATMWVRTIIMFSSHIAEL